MGYALRSSNRKTGPAVVTYTGLETCPASCPFHPVHGGGCYGTGLGFGRVGAMNREPWPDAFAAIVEGAPYRGLVRFGGLGDWLTSSGEVDRPRIRAALEVLALRRDLSAITFSHAWEAIGPAPAPWWSASCSTDGEVRAARRLGWCPVRTRSKGEQLRTYSPAVREVPCPAETAERVTCDTCRLCSKDRAAVVTFTYHGPARALAAASVAARHDEGSAA